MSFEPILLFFLIRYLRKITKNFSPDPSWDQVFKWSLYVVAALFVLNIIFIKGNSSRLFWDLLLLGTLYISLKLPVFEHIRSVLVALTPLIILTFLSNILEIFFTTAYKKVEPIFGFAFVAAVTLMVVMLIRSNKQIKALEKERQKTLQEEERSRFIAAQKDELEVIVAQRTAEIMQQKEELEHTLLELKATQNQLIHSEKMASLGELTAGIAHEIQNPLNFVNNFSEINSELIEEMKNELVAGNTQEAVSIADNIKDNEKKIITHGKRADAIVKGMLQHSRSSNGQKEMTDINALADEYLRLSYHGLRAKDKSFNATMETHFDEKIEKINVIPQDVGRAFLNLFTNAFYAVSERKKLENGDYKPTVTVCTKKLNGKIEIRVKDNGMGIPEKALEKIFQPFFTTKPSGQGTGLGLSLSYDIITQGHAGDIKVDTKEGEYAEFIVDLPA
ncbi:MAG: ATP-binding protein [Bacteroidota bacterium]|nr:ATP-binding protein [Bacteroidota bacterium]